jgi:hypothetical protein
MFICNGKLVFCPAYNEGSKDGTFLIVSLCPIEQRQCADIPLYLFFTTHIRKIAGWLSSTFIHEASNVRSKLNKTTRARAVHMIK